MFLHVCVILFTGGVPGPGGSVCSGGCLVRGGLLLGRVCLVRGGVPVPGGLVTGGCLGPGGGSGPGGCLVETPGIATAAGGTHPTGMHSCYKGNYIDLNFRVPVCAFLTQQFSTAFLSHKFLVKPQRFLA